MAIVPAAHLASDCVELVVVIVCCGFVPRLRNSLSNPSVDSGTCHNPLSNSFVDPRTRHYFLLNSLIDPKT